jgi:hypothetical protein
MVMIAKFQECRIQVVVKVVKVVIVALDCIFLSDAGLIVDDLRAKFNGPQRSLYTLRTSV